MNGVIKLDKLIELEMNGDDYDKNFCSEWQPHDQDQERPTMVGKNTQAVDKNRRFVCAICDKGFPHASWLRKHDRVHFKFKYKCRFCDEMFSDQKVRIEHENEIHGPVKKYQCDKCSKSFNYPYSLQNHYRIHTGERPFECDVCHKTFVERGAMTAHKRIHFDATPYHCNLCEQKYKHSSSLRAHKKIHERGGDFKCNLCSMCCISSKALKMHISKVHTTGLSKADKKAVTSQEETDLYPIMKLGKKFGIDFGSSVSNNPSQGSTSDDSGESSSEENYIEEPVLQSSMTPPNAKKSKYQTSSSESELDQTPEIVKVPVHRSLLSSYRKQNSKPCTNRLTSEGGNTVPVCKKSRSKRKADHESEMEETRNTMLEEEEEVHNKMLLGKASRRRRRKVGTPSESFSQPDQIQMIKIVNAVENSSTHDGWQPVKLELPGFAGKEEPEWSLSPSTVFTSDAGRSPSRARKQVVPLKLKFNRKGVNESTKVKKQTKKKREQHIPLSLNKHITKKATQSKERRKKKPAIEVKSPDPNALNTIREADSSEWWSNEVALNDASDFVSSTTSQLSISETSAVDSSEQIDEEMVFMDDMELGYVGEETVIETPRSQYDIGNVTIAHDASGF